MQKHMILGFLFMSALATSAYAQREDGSSGNQPNNATARDARICKASDIIGADVENPQGEDLGDVKDLAITPAGDDARVEYVVLSYGGALGLGDKLFAVPFKAFGVSSNGKKMSLSVPKETLKSAPGFDKDHWPDMADSSWISKINQHYGVMADDFDRDLNRDLDRRDEVRDAAKEAAKDVKMAVRPGTRRILRATKLIGADVRNPNDENLGDIEDLAIDVNNGRVAYAVLSFGGFLGIGDKLFAIPFGALDIRPTDEKAILDVPKDKLKTAPGFDKHNWPNMADPKWTASIHDYYGRDRLVARETGVATSDRKTERVGATSSDRAMLSGMLHSTKVIGTDVKNTRGESLGDIDDLIIDPNTGKVVYALVSFGGFLGIGDKSYPVPFEALRLKPGEKAVVLDVDKDRLKQAPCFDKEHCPDPTDRTEMDRLYSFYGVRPDPNR